MRKALFVIVIFLACSCGVGTSIKNALQVGSKIAAELGANNCEIGYSTNTSTGHGTSKKVTITLQGLGEEQQKQPRVKVASVAVMLYYQSFDPKEVKYEDTEVAINVGQDRYEKGFLKADIERAFRLFNPINNFFEMEKSGDFSSWQQLIDTTFISDSTFAGLRTAITEIDSTSGELNKVSITGFATNTFEDSGELVTTLWVETLNGKQFSVYRFIFMNESEKIIYIGINEVD